MWGAGEPWCGGAACSVQGAPHRALAKAHGATPSHAQRRARRGGPGSRARHPHPRTHKPCGSPNARERRASCPLAHRRQHHSVLPPSRPLPPTPASRRSNAHQIHGWPSPPQQQQQEKWGWTTVHSLSPPSGGSRHAAAGGMAGSIGVRLAERMAMQARGAAAPALAALRRPWALAPLAQQQHGSAAAGAAAAAASVPARRGLASSARTWAPARSWPASAASSPAAGKAAAATSAAGSATWSPGERRTGLLVRKIGMSQTWLPSGERMPVTVLQVRGRGGWGDGGGDRPALLHCCKSRPISSHCTPPRRLPRTMLWTCAQTRKTDILQCKLAASRSTASRG